MNILITGATGFIGSYLVRLLLNEKHNLFCTLLPNEINPFGEELVKSIVIHSNNVNETTSFLTKNGINGIIHLASLVQSDEHSSESIETLLNANITFGTLLLEAATHAKVKWFLNTGTFWQHYENKEYSPVNLYAASKQAFESIAHYYWETNKIKFCTLKLSDTYGPNDTRPKIFNLWQKIAQTGESLDMSPGEQIIDISHVDDIVSAFTLLAIHLNNDHPEVNNGDSFAVRAEKRYSLKELATVYEKASGQKLNINWGKRPYREREVMVPWSEGKNVPNFRSEIDLIEGIRRTLKTENGK